MALGLLESACACKRDAKEIMSQKFEECAIMPPRGCTCLAARAVMECFSNLNEDFKLTLSVYVSMHWEGVVCVTEQGRALYQCMSLGEDFGNDAHA